MRQERFSKILLAPHVSEKCSRLNQFNQYAFQVIQDATKDEIKKAVEFLFNVKVASVRVVSVKPKTKRFGQSMGKRRGWKKAYVSLQEGQKIEVMGVQA